MKPYKHEYGDLSNLEIMILSTLVAKERYGLDIVQAIKKVTDGRKVLSLGGLYTTLHRMEQKGLVNGRWGETTEDRQGARRRYYKATGLGQRALNETKTVLLKTFRLVTA
jgi:DNA-binding PadR family transcriptional regulator